MKLVHIGAVDMRQRRPVEGVGGRLALHDGDGVAVGLDDGIVPGEALERTAQRRRRAKALVIGKSAAIRPAPMAPPEIRTSRRDLAMCVSL